MPDAAKPVHPALEIIDIEIERWRSLIRECLAKKSDAEQHLDSLLPLRQQVAETLSAFAEPARTPRTRKPRGPNAVPDMASTSVAAEHVLALLAFESDLPEPAILANLKGKGVKKGVAKTVLRSMVKGGAVLLESGRHRLPGNDIEPQQQSAAAMGVDGREAVGIGDDPLLRKLNEVHPR